jgi:hypothetical protein
MAAHCVALDALIHSRRCVASPERLIQLDLEYDIAFCSPTEQLNPGQRHDSR